MKNYKELTNDTKKAAEFFLQYLAFTISPKCLNKMTQEDLQSFNLVDVRPYEEYIKGHIPYAMHIPYDQFDEQIEHLPKDKTTIVYNCSMICNKAKLCAYKLAEKGYPVMELRGGFKAWKKLDYEIIETDESDYPG